MIIYKESNAYDVIQSNIINNLSLYLNKNKHDIFNIVIVGAYHGYEIESFIENYINCKILAFEAFDNNYKILKDKYKNNLNVNCFNYAITNFTGEGIFYEVNNSGSGCGSLLKFIDDGKYKISEEKIVQCKKLKDILFLDKIDLLWIDVQGSELSVLKGTDLDKVESMFIEVTEDNGHIAYENNCKLSELKTYLEKEYFLHSIGLDNENNNGTGNSFWLKNKYGT